MNIRANLFSAFTRQLQLGDLLEFRNEIVHPKDQPSGPAVFVGLEHIEKDTGIRLGASQIELSEMTGRRARFKAGDIVYGYLRPYLNKVWIADFDGICSVDQYVLKVRPGYDRNYVAHFLRSETFLKTAPIDSAPGQLPRIRSGEIMATTIPTPEIENQRRISGVLDKAENLYRARRRVLDMLEGLTQSIFLDIFGDPLNNFRGLALGTLGDLVADTQYGTSEKALDEGEIPVLRMGNITFSGIMDYTNLKFLNSRVATHDKYLVRRGDLLFNRTNSSDLVGKTGLYDQDEPMAFAGYLVRVRARSENAPEYIHAHMNSRFVKTTLRKMAKSIIGMANINAKEMLTIPVLLASPSEQVDFKVRTDVIRQRILFARRAAYISRTLFASIQSKAFEGCA